MFHQYGICVYIVLDFKRDRLLTYQSNHCQNLYIQSPTENLYIISLRLIKTDFQCIFLHKMNEQTYIFWLWCWQQQQSLIALYGRRCGARLYLETSIIHFCEHIYVLDFVRTESYAVYLIVKTRASDFYINKSIQHCVPQS